jgi:predicted O-linked N-acetylglucosamine transferase (SPINDLY family)
MSRINKLQIPVCQPLAKKPAFQPSPDVANWLQEALTLHRQGRVNEAQVIYERILQKQCNHFDALQLLAVTHRQQGNSEIALEYFDKALRVDQTNAAVFNNRGIALKVLKRLDEALQSYDEAIRLKPDYAEVYYNRGITLHGLKRLDEALTSYDQAIRLKPDYAEAYNNQGITLQDLKRLDEALKSYDQAICLKPDYAEAYNNRGVSLRDLNRLDEALKSYDQAIRLKQDYTEAYYNRGATLQDLKRLDEALKSYDQAIRLKPDYAFLFGNRLHTQMKLGDWSDLSNQLLELHSRISAQHKVAMPFTVLGLTDNPELQLLTSQIYVDSKHSPSDVLGPFVKREPEGKIRIGYYSADFHNHATAYLIAELFESHDSNRFEIYGFSFGPNTNDEMRQRLSKVFNQFIDVSNYSDIEIAKMSRELKIDIGVDLKGFTTDSRTGIFALRCAPIQVNYLGYPGTMGAPYIDYIVADKTVIPIESQNYYSEKIVYMPHSYQVNDAKRKISDRLFTKQELGLPEEGFVFCCFNNTYKILPDTFDLWMDLLLEVYGSVLWLFEENQTAIKNLRMRAQKREVDPSRLVFANSMKLADHLSRLRLADLCLDTLPYNAHTTASDALWAGLPVLTLPGKSFTARVAASLLSALDIPELIAESREDYLEKAISLTRNELLLKQIKDKLDRNRLIAPLFNGQIFAKNIEKAYVAMHQRYVNGLPPDHIYISH